MYSAKIVLDSVSERGHRLTTIEASYPRLIHSEFMTHRVFSRNAASSRAIPVKKQLERVLEDPFIPESFGKNKSGMQADGELDEEETRKAREAWLNARDDAYTHASRLANLNVHKQLANRVLEPFSWITVIMTATDWQNFFRLRCHPTAQPEFQKIAGMIREVYDASVPTVLKNDEWHMPYIQPEEYQYEKIEDLQKISVARCARVSYLTHDGVRDVEKDLTLFNRLLKDKHMSPFEHVARPMAFAFVSCDCGFDDCESKRDDSTLGGNFHGWVQYRKLIPDEAAIDALWGIN